MCVIPRARCDSQNRLCGVLRIRKREWLLCFAEEYAATLYTAPTIYVVDGVTALDSERL
jgi:hypothetical protein